MSVSPILSASEDDNIMVAARLLREGAVVVVPTDTLYGLAASMFRPEAVARVFEIKHRPPQSRVPVLIATAADLPLLASEVSRAAWKLIDRFWPGPLTLVLPSRPSVSDVITRRGKTVAVRVPAATSCLRLLETLGEPIIGTSANRSGEPPATTAAEALQALGGSIDLILEDDDAIEVGLPSTVVELIDGQPVIRRAGAISEDTIRAALGSRAGLRR